jgi:hypothetical protein
MFFVFSRILFLSVSFIRPVTPDSVSEQRQRGRQNLFRNDHQIVNIPAGFHLISPASVSERSEQGHLMIQHDGNENNVANNAPNGIPMVSPLNDSFLTPPRRRHWRRNVSSNDSDDDDASMGTSDTYENDFHPYFDLFNPGNGDTPCTMDLTPSPLSFATPSSRGYAIVNSPFLPRRLQESNDRPQQEEAADQEDSIPSLVEIQMNLFENDGWDEIDTEFGGHDNVAGAINGSDGNDQVERQSLFAGVVRGFFQDPSSNEWSMQAYQIDGLSFPLENELGHHDISLDAVLSSATGHVREWRPNLESIHEELSPNSRPQNN